MERYNIEYQIGHGGMSLVHKGTDNQLNTAVAIKVLNDEYLRDNNIRKRFISEARNLARLAHPNIIKVTDLIEEDDYVAFIMEYVEGESLKQLLDRKGKLNDKEIIDLFSQMLAAVQYVHENDLVHRDIKPSNFMVNKNDTVKLLDFGIAKNLNSASAEYTITEKHQIMGTVMYMSPEQVKSTKDVSTLTDVYSLGVVLWQMLAGNRPYNQDELSIPEIQVNIIKEPLPKLGINKWDNIISLATAKDEKLRIQNCEVFLNLIKATDNDVLLNSDLNNEDQTTVSNVSSEKTIVETDGVSKNKFVNSVGQSAVSVVNVNPNKYFYLITLIKIISFVIFLLIFYLISKNEVEERNWIFFENNDFEYWKYYRLKFSRGAAIVSFVFIGFTLLYIAVFFKKLISLGYKKWMNIFRLFASIFMIAWSILLFASTGAISVHEVQAAWYFYIVLEILFSINTLTK
jgi:serine/threonine protein kinase